MPTKTDQICFTCRLPKPSLKNGLHCGLCQNILCKDCALFVEENAFAFLQMIPEELKCNSYCSPCYDKAVQPALDNYRVVLSRAKEIYVFDKKATQIPLIKRARNDVVVKDCPDKKETILRLAFQAAEQNFNAVIKTELMCDKIRINGYQTSRWSGRGRPANVRVEGLDEDATWESH